jgi:hypothetical protein
MPTKRIVILSKANVVTMLVLLLGSVVDLNAQDSTAVAKHSAKDFGLMFGASLINLQVGSEEYFNAASQQLVSVEGSNKGGLSIGLFYNVALSYKWMIRPSVEAHLSNTSVTYRINEKDELYTLYPVCIEVPITINYGLNQRPSIEQRGWKGMGFLAAVRPVIPITIFQGSTPVVKPFSLNAEVGISLPKSLRKTLWRTEVIASFNVMAINQVGNGYDFRSNMIHDIRRHFIGVRFYFN